MGQRSQLTQLRTAKLSQSSPFHLLKNADGQTLGRKPEESPGTAGQELTLDLLDPEQTPLHAVT